MFLFLFLIYSSYKGSDFNQNKEIFSNKYFDENDGNGQ